MRILDTEKLMETQAQLLTGILTDPTARPDERDDTAMDLERYSDPGVIDALVKVASSPEEDEIPATTGPNP